MNWDWMADTLSMIAIELSDRTSKNAKGDREYRRHLDKALQSTREARDSIVALYARIEALRARESGPPSEVS